MTAVDHLAGDQFYEKPHSVPITQVSKMWAGDHPGRRMSALMRMPATDRRGLRYDAADERDLVEHVKEHGITNPIKVGVGEHGPEVWDGHHRYVAARRAGVTHVPVQFVNGDTWSGAAEHRLEPK